MTSAAIGQALLQPTPTPTATADNQTWYQRSEPVVFAGNLYYPTGSKSAFNGNEMVLSGFYGGVPLYTRTTIEPYSQVYVPITGGWMQAYERPRTGELAGTVGSTSTLLTTAFPAVPTSALGMLPQAAGPPVLSRPVLSVASPPTPEPAVPATVLAASASSEPLAVGTVGTVASRAPAASRIRRQPSHLFVEFDNTRWFSAGVPVPFDANRFERIGEYRGFPVYAARSGPPSTIYVPLGRDLADAVAPYVRRTGRR
jgi:hypothetical protein